MSDQMDIFDLTAGRRQRDAGIAVADTNADILWREGVDRAIRDLAAIGQPFNADSIRAIAGSPPPGFSPNAMGARFSAASKAGVIVPLGYRQSTRPERHANAMKLWIGAEPYR